MDAWMIGVGVVVVALVLLAFIRRSFVVGHSQEIEADRDAIWEQIVDFRNWPAWSPWLAHDPECRTEYSENTSQEGSWHSWDGERIGSGRITHTKIGENTIEESIEFHRPRYPACPVKWRLDKLAEKRYRLTWTMRGSMPLLLGFMIGGMKKQILRDYHIGLWALSRIVNPKAEAPRLSYVHPAKIESRYYLGIRHRCRTEDIGPWMNANMPRLSEALASHQAEQVDAPFTIWEKLHFGGREFTFICALPVSREDADKIKGDAEAAGMLTGFYQGGENYAETLLEGDYRFLSTAWLVAFDHLKMAKLKFDRSCNPIEIYANDPEAVGHSNEIRTRILIGVRS